MRKIKVMSLKIIKLGVWYLGVGDKEMGCGRRKQGNLMVLLMLFLKFGVYFIILLHCLCIVDINYFVPITYFIIFKSELNMLPLNVLFLGLSILETNSTFHTGAWGHLTSSCSSLPHLIKSCILALHTFTTLGHPAQPRTFCLSLRSQRPYQLPDHSSCGSCHSCPSSRPPLYCGQDDISRADLFHHLLLNPCSIFPLTLVQTPKSIRGCFQGGVIWLRPPL